MMEVEQIKTTTRPSYTKMLLALEVGKEHRYPLMGTAYQQFQNAKHRLKKAGKAEFEMNVMEDNTLRVVRLN